MIIPEYPTTSLIGTDLSQTNIEEIVNPYDDNSNLMQSIALLPVKCTSTLAPVDRNQQIGVIKQRQSLESWFTPSIQLQHQEATKPLIVHRKEG